MNPELVEQFAAKVADAWLNQGPRSDIHMEAQMKLKKEWPVLWFAVRNLAKVYEHNYPRKKL